MRPRPFPLTLPNAKHQPLETRCSFAVPAFKRKHELIQNRAEAGCRRAERKRSGRHATLESTDGPSSGKGTMMSTRLPVDVPGLRRLAARIRLNATRMVAIQG